MEDAEVKSEEKKNAIIAIIERIMKNRERKGK